MAATKKATGKAVEPTVTREAMMQEYASMLEVFPYAEADDGFGIIADILTATDIDEMNSGSKLPSADELCPAMLKVLGATRHDSDLENGMPFYLVVDYVDVDSGMVGKFQTSAGTLMAVITRLAFLRKLPAILSIAKKDKATRGGFHPIQVTVKSASAN